MPKQSPSKKTLFPGRAEPTENMVEVNLLDNLTSLANPSSEAAVSKNPRRRSKSKRKLLESDASAPGAPGSIGPPLGHKRNSLSPDAKMSTVAFKNIAKAKHDQTRRAVREIKSKLVRKTTNSDKAAPYFDVEEPAEASTFDSNQRPENPYKMQMEIMRERLGKIKDELTLSKKFKATGPAASLVHDQLEDPSPSDSRVLMGSTPQQKHLKREPLSSGSLGHAAQQRPEDLNEIRQTIVLERNDPARQSLQLGSTPATRDVDKLLMSPEVGKGSSQRKKGSAKRKTKGSAPPIKPKPKETSLAGGMQKNETRRPRSGGTATIAASTALKREEEVKLRMPPPEIPKSDFVQKTLMEKAKTHAATTIQTAWRGKTERARYVARVAEQARQRELEATAKEAERKHRQQERPCGDKSANSQSK